MELLESPKLAPRNRREGRLCKDGIRKKSIRTYPTNSEYVQKFVSLMNITENENECWHWMGSSRVRDYGGMWFKGKIWLAHRLCLLFSGRNPGKKLVCHHCDNPRCVNPRHLFIGTMSDNLRDMFNKGRGNRPRGEDSWKSTTTESNVLAMRKEYIPGVVSQKQLAEKYNITQNTVCLIINRHSWKHV